MLRLLNLSYYFIIINDFHHHRHIANNNNNNKLSMFLCGCANYNIVLMIIRSLEFLHLCVCVNELTMKNIERAC